MTGRFCPLTEVRHVIRTLTLALALALTLTTTTHARPLVAPTPIKAPDALVRARAACPPTATRTCYLTALRHAYADLEWQRGARQHTEAMTVQAITRDAIAWAAARWHVSALDMTTVANCESHLWPFASNGQYKGAWQLGAMHLSDPIFLVVPWQDAYAEASHVARFVKAHGWSAWQCRPGGGLRW